MPESQPLLQPCPSCAALLDVSEEEPFAQVHCPMCGTAVRARTQFHNFELQSILGAGGMGTVYKARDVTLNRFVALKLLQKQFSESAEYVAKFEMEAKITASINHPHVVKVYSFGEDHGIVYIAMELVEKGSLDDFMNLQGRVAESQVLEIGIQIAQGLQAANRVGLIHRDVKPGNILFADAHIAKIVDFGLAVLMEQQAQEGEIWGTPYYVAPEVLNREPEDFRSDIYSLGGTLFHAAAGRPPFEAETASMVVLKHMKSQAVSLQAFAPDISSPTAYVINRMLNKDREERYSSYDELIEHLSYARDKLTEAASRPHQPKTRVITESETHQRLVVWFTLGLAALFLVAVMLVVVFRDRIFKSSGESAEARQSVPVKSADDIFRENYEEARKTLIAGDFVAAKQQFGALVQQEKSSQPLKNWAIFHLGLTELLDGALADAQATFKRLKTGGMYSMEPADKRLANFFLESGRLLTYEKSLPALMARDYKVQFEPLALLAFALKDWLQSDFINAGRLLDGYLAAEPSADYSWILDYAPLLAGYVEDAKGYVAVAAQFEAAGDDKQKQQAAIEAVQSLRSKLHKPGKLTEKLVEMELNLKKRMTTVAKVERQREETGWKMILPKIAPLIRDWKPDEARALIEATRVEDDSVKAQKAALLKKVEWISDFKKTLIQDINEKGFPEPVAKKNGSLVPGPFKKASSTQMEMITPYGSITAPWTSLAPTSVLAMADYFAGKVGDAAAAADRLWRSGVYAFETDLQSEGRSRMIKASQAKEEYREQLSLFFEPGSER
jgi:serine/threonine protein kinase